MKNLVSLFIFVSSFLIQSALSEPDFMHVNPERIDAALSQFTDSGQAVGISAIVYENGKEAYFGAFGYANKESGKAMSRDTLVQIFSMTKPITGVALMMLYEEGKFELDDPLSMHAPEFANLKVYAGEDESGEAIYEDPIRPATLRDIMRHTGGFASPWDGSTPVGKIFREIDPMNRENTLTEMAERMGKIPLLYQPGTQWLYGPSADIQAFFVERFSGMTFDTYIKTKIFDPLGMKDTRYVIPAGEWDRLSTMYQRSDDGVYTPSGERSYSYNRKEWPLKQGGQGLTSSIDDYITFARMIQNEGKINGVRILKADTVKLMSTDAMPKDVVDKSWLPSHGQYGFGIDFAVRVAPPANAEEGSGEMGEIYWDGAANTLFWVDSVNDITAVLFTQYHPYGKIPLHKAFRDAVYHDDRTAFAK